MEFHQNFTVIPDDYLSNSSRIPQEYRFKIPPFFLYTYTHLGILIAGELEEKEKLKKFLMWGKFSFHVMVDPELFTYVKNRKQLIY